MADKYSIGIYLSPFRGSEVLRSGGLDPLLVNPEPVNAYIYLIFVNSELVIQIGKMAVIL